MNATEIVCAAIYVLMIVGTGNGWKCRPVYKHAFRNSGCGN